MDAREFLELAAKLKIDEGTAENPVLQGLASDIVRFLEAGDPTVEHLFVGVYGAMMAANLDRVYLALTGENTIDKDVPVRLRITEDSLTLERVPADEEVQDD